MSYYLLHHYYYFYLNQYNRFAALFDGERQIAVVELMFLVSSSSSFSRSQLPFYRVTVCMICLALAQIKQTHTGL